MPLPLLAACLLTEEPVILRNVPRIRDVEARRQLIADVGTEVAELDAHTWRLHTPRLVKGALDAELCRRIRASMLLAIAGCGGGDDSGTDNGRDVDADQDIAAADDAAGDAEEADGDGDADVSADADGDGDADADGDGDADVDGADDGGTDVGEDDGGTDDASTIVPLDGFGTIAGDCGVLDDTEWSSAEPFLFPAL